MRCIRLRLKANPDIKHFQPSHVKQKRCNPFNAAAYLYVCLLILTSIQAEALLWIWLGFCFGALRALDKNRTSTTQSLQLDHDCVWEKTHSWTIEKCLRSRRYQITAGKRPEGRLIWWWKSSSHVKVMTITVCFIWLHTMIRYNYTDMIKERLSCETDVTACAWNPLWEKLVIESIQVEATIIKTWFHFTKTNWTFFLDVST